MPAFSRKYVWRVTAFDKKNKQLSRTKIFAFETAYAPYIDTNIYKLQVIANNGHHSDMFIILDHSSVIYDMNGAPVWYLPDIPGRFQRDRRTRDLKLTKDGTFTILNDFGAFEIDYDGNVLWKAPDDGKVSGDTSERYHHEFTKLNNGNYLVAGYEKILVPVPSSFDSAKIPIDETIKKEGGKLLKRVDCGTIIMYNKEGEVIWSWKTSDHFTETDFFQNIMPDGTPNTNTHLNAVYFDEIRGYMYASFRDINTILKIEYPSGKVVRRYGKPLERLRDGTDRSPFKAQHACRISKDGQLYLFNNNTARTREVISTVTFFEEPSADGGTLKKIWEYPCNIDTYAAPGTASGGGVYMLSDSCVLASMGVEGRVFIVNYDKELLWNAVPRYKNDSGIWEVLPIYRAAYIESYKLMESVIFKNINKKELKK